MTSLLQGERNPNTDLTSRVPRRSYLYYPLPVPVTQSVSYKYKPKLNFIRVTKREINTVSYEDFCPICLDNIPLRDIVTTQCNHKLCLECASELLKTSSDCPCCRSEIINMLNKYAYTDASSINELQKSERFAKLREFVLF